MKTAHNFTLVLVTVPSTAVARKLARTLLEARLAACANLVPAIESHYWWQGKITSSKEVLLLLKTTRRRTAALERAILAAHPYDTPEFIVLSPSLGNRRYLQWLQDSVSSKRPR